MKNIQQTAARMHSRDAALRLQRQLTAGAAMVAMAGVARRDTLRRLGSWTRTAM